MNPRATSPTTRPAPRWRSWLFALIRAWWFAFYRDVVHQLAYGPDPTPEDWRRMCEALVKSESRLVRAIHAAARHQAGLPRQRRPQRIRRARPRSFREMGQRLRIHGRMLLDPHAHITRIVRRMASDARRRAAPSTHFDPTSTAPPRTPRAPSFTPPRPSRALELSG